MILLKRGNIGIALILAFTGMMLFGSVTTSVTYFHKVSSDALAPKLVDCHALSYSGTTNEKIPVHYSVGNPSSSQTGMFAFTQSCSNNMWTAPTQAGGLIRRNQPERVIMVTTELLLSQLFVFDEPDPPRHI